MMTHTFSVDDDKLIDRVYRALDGIEPLRVLGSPVYVQVKDGVVTLHGVVATYPIKARALEAVRSTRGVRQVRDELLTDSELEIRIAHALSADPSTRAAAFGIFVNAINGFVSLVGRVSTLEISRTAEAIAASVPDVRGVSNLLQVFPNGGRRDAGHIGS
jgi:osmotically-inducible protein OsmY